MGIKIGLVGMDLGQDVAVDQEFYEISVLFESKDPQCPKLVISEPHLPGELWRPDKEALESLHNLSFCPIQCIGL